MKPTDTLQRLAQGDAKRKTAGQIRAIFDQIEETAAAGVPLKTIWEALKTDGIDTTFPYFKNMLYRIRKERKEKGLSSQKRQEEKNTIIGKSEAENVAKNFFDKVGATTKAKGFEHSATPPDSDELI